MTETTGDGSKEKSEPKESFAPESDGFFGRFLDLFRNPRRLMDNVGRHPRWWAPLLFIFVVVAFSSWMIMPIAAPESLGKMQDSVFGMALSDEDLQEIAEGAREITPTRRVLQALQDSIVNLVFIMLFGLALGMFAQLSGGQVKYGQALGITVWGAVPVYALNMLVRIPLAYATGSVFRYSVGLAALAPGADTGSFLFKVLYNYGDFFTWWGLVLVIIGFRRVFGMALGPAILSVILPWIVMMAFPLGIMLLFM